MAKEKTESTKKVDKAEETKSDPPKDKKNGDKPAKEEPKMLNVKENSSIGVFILLVGLNVFACALLKHHFANVLSELDGAISELEHNTNILYHAWGPQTIENAKLMYDQSKTWTDELVANVTGPQTDALIKRVQVGQKNAEEKMVEMELMLKRYKSGEPIFDFEGSLKNDTFKPADIKE